MKIVPAVVAVLMLLGICSDSQAADKPVDFQKEVAPIFARRCVSCHGEKQRKGGLRLTNRRDAMTPGDSGFAVIEPGNVEGSMLVERILSTSEEEQMPPKGERLTKAETATIQRWIKEGAKWPELTRKKHWAYVKPVQATLPAVNNKSWSRNAVDAFLLAKMEAEGMQPSPPADKARLLRRLHLTLTGLPPTVEQVDAFLRDDSPAAYERVVDELLKSPRFGERWARLWLDLARYADSNGFQADQLRDSWAWRDWVIQALNKDMPFDQFVIEQLAGDLLPNATTAQKIATGFHRTVTCNVEAGVHPEENRVNQVFDRVNTTGMVFLGMTMECAQCHNHKYDPIPQQEYYRLFAYFNNTPLEVGNNSGVSFNFTGPKMALPLPAEKQAERNLLLKQQTELQNKRKELLATAFPEWEKQVTKNLPETSPWQPLEVEKVTGTGGETFEPQKDGSILVGGKVPDKTKYTVELKPGESRITALKLECLTHPKLPGNGPGRGDKVRRNYILSEFQARLGEQKIGFSQARADFSQARWPVSQAIDGDLKAGWAISPEFGKPHWAIFTLKEPLTITGDSLLTLELHQNYGQGRTIGCFRVSAFTGDRSMLGVPEDITKILQQKKRNKKDKQQLETYFVSTHKEIKTLDADLAKLKKRVDAIEPATTLVMVEMEKARETSMLIRGNYLTKGKPVEPGTPSVLHPLDPELPKNRLGFAKWLTDRENPLLARVTINRWWAAVWGQGIVTTPEDFGTQSDPPTHPELLDWLAVDFMENGWSMKHTLKLMVMSNAFRQSSRITPQGLDRDPANQLYARGPRFRMSAEMIRDNGLQVSGLLSTKAGGPPIMPYQPDGLWNTVGRNAPKWISANDENRFRRGVYVVWRRAAPYPSFINFDAPDRAACVVQRARTNTATQALTLLNDPAYLEMALSLAYHILTDQPGLTTEQKARTGFRRAVSREPNERELQILTSLYQQELERLRKSPATAKELVDNINGVKLPRVADPVELAAWLHVANVLLNLDETITRN